MSEIRGADIHVTGIVQGVGFRPFVYALAKRHALKGWVRNTSAGVDIALDGDAAALQAFLSALESEAPPLARIDRVTVEGRGPNGFSDFEILPSRAFPEAYQPISPDVGICPDCLRELFDTNDRRYRYPFINCTHCGPRFTIITDIPYDRPNTTMASFPMCPACAAEYDDPLDRRFHAQPVACPSCGPRVWLEMDGRRLAERDEAIRLARQAIREGRILAVKGLGGFHLACDATSEAAVSALRLRKLRADKPFAVMMVDSGAAAEQCVLIASEQELLESRQRPIVVLERRASSCVSAAVAPGQHTIGVMLPYTPLHYLLLEREAGFPTALVMTSGNMSEEPIVTQNAEASKRLASLADAWLLHDRDIHMRCDDSVVRVYPAVKSAPQIEGTILPIRRSRGYAPFPVRMPWDSPPLLAVGGELKNVFCVVQGSYAFMSQHIGDLENFETLRSFEGSVRHFERLFRIRPQAIACDLHPDYLATRYALDRAQAEGLPLIGVQHHHAHLAGCMLENGLDEGRTVIGIAFDGVGYGTDGTIWGGEVLLTTLHGFQRMAHLRPVPLPGGDAAVRQPWRQALTWLRVAGLSWDGDLTPLMAAGDVRRQSVARMLDLVLAGNGHGLNAPWTSSAGRLFDAVSALLGICNQVNYEGQAAIELEAAADPDETGVYDFGLEGEVMDPAPLIAALVADLRRGERIPALAARFHNTLAEMILSVCRKVRVSSGCEDVALSGGVWQNVTLLRRTLARLSGEGFRVLVHSQVPPNDGGLALGQAAVAAAQMRAGVVTSAEWIPAGAP